MYYNYYYLYVYNKLARNASAKSILLLNYNILLSLYLYIIFPVKYDRERHIAEKISIVDDDSLGTFLAVFIRTHSKTLVKSFLI